MICMYLTIDSTCAKHVDTTFAEYGATLIKQ